MRSAKVVIKLSEAGVLMIAIAHIRISALELLINNNKGRTANSQTLGANNVELLYI